MHEPWNGKFVTNLVEIPDIGLALREFQGAFLERQPAFERLGGQLQPLVIRELLAKERNKPLRDFGRVALSLW